jgi:hypothetical protein
MTTDILLQFDPSVDTTRWGELRISADAEDDLRQTLSELGVSTDSPDSTVGLSAPDNNLSTVMLFGQFLVPIIGDLIRGFFGRTKDRPWTSVAFEAGDVRVVVTGEDLDLDAVANFIATLVHGLATRRQPPAVKPTKLG